MKKISIRIDTDQTTKDFRALHISNIEEEYRLKKEIKNIEAEVEMYKRLNSEISAVIPEEKE